MSMSFKQFVSFQIFRKSDTVSQAASDAEAAYVVAIGLLKYTPSPETSVVPVAVSVDGANQAFLFCFANIFFMIFNYVLVYLFYYN